jgi:hypothetical protein
MKQHHIIIFCLIVSIKALNAGNYDFFPERTDIFSASTLEFRHYIYTGSENSRVVNHGNLGVDFPVVSYQAGDFRIYGAGVTAAANLVMFPRNMKFAVDNFYATLAVYVDAVIAPAIKLRLYPVYHVSGHLGDGSQNDSMLANAHAVSSEMARLEGEYSPLKWATFSAGYGYYYHVCAQQGLTDRFDIAMRYRPVRDDAVKPYLTIVGQFVYMHEWRAGMDMEAGVKLVNSRGRGIGVGIRYFNQMHPGYYFDRREKSAGVQIDFVL